MNTDGGCSRNIDNWDLFYLLWIQIVRSIGEQPYDIKGFQVRFVSLHDLEVTLSKYQEMLVFSWTAVVNGYDFHS